MDLSMGKTKKKRRPFLGRGELFLESKPQTPRKGGLRGRNPLGNWDLAEAVAFSGRNANPTDGWEPPSLGGELSSQSHLEAWIVQNLSYSTP